MAAPMEGVRVLDLSEGYEGYTGMMLAEIGATVIKVKPPEGVESEPFKRDACGLRHGSVCSTPRDSGTALRFRGGRGVCARSPVTMARSCPCMRRPRAGRMPPRSRCRAEMP